MNNVIESIYGAFCGIVGVPKNTNNPNATGRVAKKVARKKCLAVKKARPRKAAAKKALGCGFDFRMSCHASCGKKALAKREVGKNRRKPRRNLSPMKLAVSVSEKRPGDVFISYSRKDKGIVMPIYEEIRKSMGIDPWIDLEGIETGAQFEDKIMDAIDRCKVFVFLMSKNSMESPWTRREFDYAMNMGKKVCPVRIDDSRPARWFLFKYGGLDCVDYADSAQREKMFQDIVAWTRSAKGGALG